MSSEDAFLHPPAILVVLDDHGVILSVAPPAQYLVDVANTPPASVPFLDLVHPDDRQSVADCVRLDSAFSASCYSESRCRMLDGQYRRFTWTFLRLESEAAVYAVGRDITERKHHEQELEQQRILSEALRETIAALTSTLDLKTVMARILDNVGRVVPHDASNIMVLEGDTARVLYSRGYTPDSGEIVTGFGFPPNENRLLKKLRESNEPYLIRSTQLHPDWLTSPINDWVRSYVGVPIRSHDQTIGFLNLDSATEDFFTPQHAERLGLFADYAAIAVENAQLYETMSGYAAELAARVEERTTELQREKERIETILASTSDALAVISRLGLIQQINPAFSRMFDVGEDEASRMMLVTFVDDPQLFLGAVDQVFQSLEPRRIELQMRRQNATPFDADLVLSPIGDGEVNAIVCSIRDISERMRMESELRRALEREKELSVLKSRFISMASHEFRTPLATILSSSELLRRYSDRMSPDAARAHFDTIESSVRHITQMIEDVLIIGKADEGRLSFSPAPLDLVSFCRELIAEVAQPESAAGRINFLPAEAVLEAYADKQLIRQIVTNLLSNALKYSPAPLPIDFSLRRDGDTIVFTVADKGIGIPQQDQPQLFDAFHRGSNVGYIEGSGLGLAILKRAVDLHHGEISFESIENAGTTFVVSLPIAK
jgi:PAS domain S-box-containing protein